MRVLSLFDGISCGRLALERAGIPVDVYYASEIDKYAIQITQKNYPDTIQIGDVCKIDFTQYRDKVDIIIGGSPCQDLSIAKQNRQGLRGERSGLFWRYVDALATVRPKYFLLENVASMRDEDRDAITETLRRIYPETECIMINAALVSAQQRRRYYWTNWHVEQPEDKGIVLKDILVSGDADREKSHAVISSIGRTTEREYFKKNQGQLVAERFYMTEKNLEHVMRPYGSKAPNITGLEKCPTICAAMGTGGGNIPYMFQPERIGELPGVGKGQANRVYSVRGKSACLNANGGGGGAKTGLYKIDLPDGEYTVRKLMPIECERLMTLPDGYTEGISNSQRYKALGNGWVVDVIVHIFKGLKQ